MILVLLCVAGGLLAWSRRGGDADTLYARITLEGKVVREIPLGGEEAVVLPERPNVRLEIRGDTAGFVHSDCPDQVCVHTGFLSRGGQFAACLPNRMTLTLVSKQEPELDVVVS